MRPALTVSLTSLLALALLLPAAALAGPGKKKKPKPSTEAACANIVDLRVKAYGAEPYEQQRRLLEEEGVAFLHGRVNLRRFRWQPSLDQLLWGPMA